MLLNLNLKQALSVDPAIDSNKFYSLHSLPSAYANILYLKNYRNPHYNFDYDIQVPTKKYERDYEISVNGITADNINDRNKKINDLYDIDITQSFEANFDKTFKSFYKGFNKAKVKNLLNYAKEADALLAISGKTEYISNYPERFSSKVDNYLSTYQNYHINNNKLYNIGMLKGIRNYIKSGNILNANALWFSYNYKTIQDNYFLEKLSINNPLKCYRLPII